MSASSPDDFDFLLGSWRVRSRRLVTRLAGSDEWVEFPARLEGGGKILGGLALIDQFKTELDGEAFEGLSLRVFDPATGRWTIYWADTARPRLTEQVVGGFENGVGTFHGEEVFEGRTVELRFVWSRITPASARWEQAYFDEKRDGWETNWVMDFERTEDA